MEPRMELPLREDRHRLLWICAKVAEDWAVEREDAALPVRLADWLRLEIVRRTGFDFVRTPMGVIEALHHPCSEWLAGGSKEAILRAGEHTKSEVTEYGLRLLARFPALDLGARRSDLVVECAVVAASWGTPSMATRAAVLWERIKGHWSGVGREGWPAVRLDELLALPLSFWLQGAQGDPVLCYSTAGRLAPARWVLELTGQELAEVEG